MAPLFPPRETWNELVSCLSLGFLICKTETIIFQSLDSRGRLPTVNPGSASCELRGQGDLLNLPVPQFPHL